MPARKPGGIAKIALPLCRMYSFSASWPDSLELSPGPHRDDIGLDL
ncbi:MULTISPECIES: hypothetical protein [unclassified Frankia]